MTNVRLTLMAAAALIGVYATAANAEVTVTLNDVHLCCGGCLKGVAKAVDSVDGASVKCNKNAKTVAVTASDAATAQKALDAIATAGFHGKSDNKEIKIKEDDTKAPDGSVERLVVNVGHNCCGACAKGVKKALDGVDGVKGAAVKGKNPKVVIEGNFSAKAVITALRAAGFHAVAAK